MAKVLDQFPEVENLTGRQGLYKEEWFDGQARCLFPEDLTQYKSVNSARSSLTNQARARGLEIRIAQHLGNLYFQVVKENVTP
tara:strand:- start:310 stop:558 length:249 start_codon:yes stop_codon:yes gene_type:complete